MRKTVVIWAFYAFALFVVGPAVRFLLIGTPAAWGGENATPLASASPVIGLVRAVAALLLAGGVGFALARFASPGRGMIAMGFALAWAPFSTARADELIRSAQSTAPLLRLVIEGVLLGALAVLIVRIVARRDLETSRPTEPGAMGPVVLGIVVCCVVAAIAGWLVARSHEPGQALGAAFAGGLFGMLVARVLAPQAPVPVLFVGLMILAPVSPLAGAMLESGGAVPAVYEGSFTALARILPLDWIAGALLGAPVGAAWAESMIERHHPATEAA